MICVFVFYTLSFFLKKSTNELKNWEKKKKRVKDFKRAYKHKLHKKKHINPLSSTMSNKKRTFKLQLKQQLEKHHNKCIWDLSISPNRLYS